MNPEFVNKRRTIKQVSPVDLHRFTDFFMMTAPQTQYWARQIMAKLNGSGRTINYDQLYYYCQAHEHALVQERYIDVMRFLWSAKIPTARRYKTPIDTLQRIAGKTGKTGKIATGGEFAEAYSSCSWFRFCDLLGLEPDSKYDATTLEKTGQRSFTMTDTLYEQAKCGKYVCLLRDLSVVDAMYAQNTLIVKVHPESHWYDYQLYTDMRAAFDGSASVAFFGAPTNRTFFYDGFRVGCLAPFAV